MTDCECREKHVVHHGPSADFLVDSLQCDALEEWTSLVDRLKRYTVPGRLKLAVICDTEEDEVAKFVSESLIQLPQLGHCALRYCPYTFLGNDQEDYFAVRLLAKETAAKTTGRQANLTNSTQTLANSASPNVTPFQDSPRKIFPRILEETDLVCQCHLQWKPFNGFDVFRPESHAQSTCSTCIEVLESSCEPSAIRHYGAIGCECACWKFPTALFQINHDVRHEALRIFFSKNHFILLRTEGRQIPRPPNADPLPYSSIDDFPRLIAQMPTEAIKYLRSIQFVLPQWNYCLPGSTSLNELLDTIDTLFNYARLDQLTIAVDLSSGRYDDLRTFDIHGISNPLARALVIDGGLWGGPHEIVDPFMMLEGLGLKDFFVHLTPLVGDQAPEEIARWKEYGDFHERHLEQHVMGKDYDAAVRGKFLQWRQTPRWWRKVDWLGEESY